MATSYDRRSRILALNARSARHYSPAKCSLPARLMQPREGIHSTTRLQLCSMRHQPFSRPCALAATPFLLATRRQTSYRTLYKHCTKLAYTSHCIPRWLARMSCTSIFRRVAYHLLGYPHEGLLSQYLWRKCNRTCRRRPLA